LKTSLTPHGPQFSFLDECAVERIDKRAVGSKWLDPKAEFFGGHFPGQPIMPGVLLIECAAQAAGVLWHVISRGGAADPGSLEKPQPLYLAQVVQFKFTEPARPGETVQIEVNVEKEMGELAQFHAVLAAGGRPVAEGRFILSRRSSTAP
jgi:3-hydroxyacyl-[acyl-carrier-protein] dehydratase